MPTILVIDDDATTREMIIEHLKAARYSFLVADNGRRGILIAQTARPDLILCDVNMPVMDGYQVLRQLRADEMTASIPFVFLSAKIDREAIRQGMDLGADDYLTKPFYHQELISAIESRLERHDVVKQEPPSDMYQELTRLITHELRTPLSNILYAANFLNMQYTQLSEGEMSEFIGNIHSGIFRLNHIVDQMVLHARLNSALIDEQTVQETGRVTAWNEIHTAFIDSARQRAYRNKDISIVENHMALDAWIRCLVAPLKHAFIELVINAINFSPSDGVVVIESWEEGEELMVRVVDQGLGIPQQHLRTALAPMQQINRSVAEQQGMGLGLSLANRIIRAHGGNLWLDSRENGGTRVVVTLPLVR